MDYPKMGDKIEIFDLEKTQEQLKAALDFLAQEAKAGKTIVFVGINPII